MFKHILNLLKATFLSVITSGHHCDRAESKLTTKLFSKTFLCVKPECNFSNVVIDVVRCLCV